MLQDGTDLRHARHLREGMVSACSYTKTVREESHMAWKGQHEKRLDVTEYGGNAENGISKGPDLVVATTDQRILTLPEAQATVAE